MREILFRGKDKDKKWIYGDLITEWGFHFDGEFMKKYRYKKVYTILKENPYANGNYANAWKEEYGFVFYDETIGQYIGLKDIDGNKIFEGDIVDILTENEESGYIKFEDGAFIVVADGFCVDFVNNLHGEDVRVVGNIYDNPEYLNFKIEMMEDTNNDK